MQKEFKTVSIQVYRTPDNQPTCARDFTTGDYCKFLLSTRFGFEYQCALQSNVTHLDSYFDANLGEYGEYTYLIPFEMCPVWRKDNDS